MKRLLFTNDPYHNTYIEMASYLQEYEEMSEEEALQEVYSDIDLESDEFHNLLKAMDNGEKILCIGNLGLWNGRASGYREFDNWEDVAYIGHGYIEFYIENGCFRAIDRHHDGTNYYTFYIVKEDAGYDSYNNLLDAIYEGKQILPNQIYRNCRSLGKYYQKHKEAYL